MVETCRDRQDEQNPFNQAIRGFLLAFSCGLRYNRQGGRERRRATDPLRPPLERRPMNRTYVALDLETTGLDPKRDAIMEVGAVRFRTSFVNGTVQAQVLDSWGSLINPGRPIPIQIQQLTGITHEKVIHSPRFSQVIDKVSRFVGNHSVVGHSVSFDLAFLRSHDLPLANPILDTFELAGILMPHATRYSLTRLGEALGLPNLCTHRALDDALAAKDLFVALLERASQLPLAIVREINRLAGGMDWSLAAGFRDIERNQARTAFGGSIGQQLAAQLGAAEDALGPLFATVQDSGEELTRAATPRALDVDELAAMLEEDGLFAHL